MGLQEGPQEVGEDTLRDSIHVLEGTLGRGVGDERHLFYHLGEERKGLDGGLDLVGLTSSLLHFSPLEETISSC